MNEASANHAPQPDPRALVAIVAPSRGVRVAAWIAGTAAVCAFYEHLPQHPDIRRDLTRWLAREEFTDLREAFRCHLPEQDFADFEAEFLGTTKSAGK